MTAQTRTRTESRLVRPIMYSEDLLNGCALKLSSDDEFSQSGNVDASHLDVGQLAPELDLVYEPQKIESATGLPPDALDILVSIEDRALKNLQIAHRKRADQAANEQFSLPKPMVESTSWACDTRITVAIVLRKDRKEDDGLAYRVGHWVAKKEFRIAGARRIADFPIKVVDPEDFVRRGLPKKTAYCVEIIGEDFNQPREHLPELVTVLVNREVSHVLCNAERSTSGKALVKTIFADIVSTILSSGLRGFSEADLLPDSILDSALTRLSKAVNLNPQRLVEMAQSPGACELRAVIQAEADLIRTLVTARF